MKYKDSSLPVDERVDNLLELMTIEEKIGQLVQPFGWKTYKKDGESFSLTDSFKDEIRQGGIGSLYGVLRADPWTEVTLDTGLSPKEGAAAINEIQRFAIEHSHCDRD